MVTKRKIRPITGITSGPIGSSARPELSHREQVLGDEIRLMSGSHPATKDHLILVLTFNFLASIGPVDFQDVHVAGEEVGGGVGAGARRARVVVHGGGIARGLSSFSIPHR